MNEPTEEIRNFLNEQENLDVMTYFSKGDSYDEIAKKIGRSEPFVKSSVEFLKKHGLIPFGRWNIDVDALEMIKTLVFCNYTEDSWNKLFRRNFFLSYFSQIDVGKTKYLAMYTFPKEVKDRIGIQITSWYYTFPNFEIPFFKYDFNADLFLEQYENEENSNTLPQRGDNSRNPDLIDLFICRYIQKETGAVNLKKYSTRMEKEIGDIIDVDEDEVRAHFERLVDNHVIYPVVPLEFSEISYIHIYCITSLDDIFRLMKMLNRFNIIAGLSFIMGKKAFLYIHCPSNLTRTIMEVFSQLDRESEIYHVTKFRKNLGLPYKYYLKKCKNSKENKIKRR